MDHTGSELNCTLDNDIFEKQFARYHSPEGKKLPRDCRPKQFL